MFRNIYGEGGNKLTAWYAIFSKQYKREFGKNPPINVKEFINLFSKHSKYNYSSFLIIINDFLSLKSLQPKNIEEKQYSVPLGDFEGEIKGVQRGEFEGELEGEIKYLKNKIEILHKSYSDSLISLTEEILNRIPNNKYYDDMFRNLNGHISEIANKIDIFTSNLNDVIDYVKRNKKSYDDRMKQRQEDIIESEKYIEREKKYVPSSKKGTGFLGDVSSKEIYSYLNSLIHDYSPQELEMLREKINEEDRQNRLREIERLIAEQQIANI